MPSCTQQSAETSATSMRSVHTLSDETLVQAAKRGHSTAFATLSERHRHQLFRAARRITRSSEDAEDAVQDSLLRAFVHLTDFDGRSSFATWLTRIAINSALMILRKKRASHEIATGYDDDFGEEGFRYEITDHRPSPETRYAQGEAETILKKAIQNLRPALRVVVQIQQLQERPLRETAEAIGISLTAAKGRLFHAKNALRRSLIPKLLRRPRFGGKFRVLRAGAGSRRANARSDQQQSTHKKEGHEHVIEIKENWKYGAPGNLHSGGYRKSFSRALGA
jgi:RNA polymerase sigma-70 factor (ECF subfamily)